MKLFHDFLHFLIQIIVDDDEGTKHNCVNPTV